MFLSQPTTVCPKVRMCEAEPAVICKLGILGCSSRRRRFATLLCCLKQMIRRCALVSSVVLCSCGAKTSTLAKISRRNAHNSDSRIQPQSVSWPCAPCRNAVTADYQQQKLANLADHPNPTQTHNSVTRPLFVIVAPLSPLSPLSPLHHQPLPTLTHTRTLPLDQTHHPDHNISTICPHVLHLNIDKRFSASLSRQAMALHQLFTLAFALHLEPLPTLDYATVPYVKDPSRSADSLEEPQILRVGANTRLEPIHTRHLPHSIDTLSFLLNHTRAIDAVEPFSKLISLLDEADDDPEFRNLRDFFDARYGEDGTLVGAEKEPRRRMRSVSRAASTLQPGRRSQSCHGSAQVVLRSQSGRS